MQADRQNRYGALADKYAGSELKRVNMRELERYMTTKTELPADVQKDVHSNSETSNPWWWITWVLLQVCSCFLTHHPAAVFKLSTQGTTTHPAASECLAGGHCRGLVTACILLFALDQHRCQVPKNSLYP